MWPASSLGGSPYLVQTPSAEGPNAMTPIRRERTPASKQAVGLNALLGGPSGSMTIWNIAEHPSTAQRISSYGTIEPISARLLEQPATRPFVRDMRIIYPPLPWELEIRVPLREPENGVTVENVLECIHMSLHEPVEKDEWQDNNPALQRKIYGAMCERIRNSPPSIKVDGQILRIDYLLGKSVFRGLRPLGPSGKEWSLLIDRQIN